MPLLTHRACTVGSHEWIFPLLSFPVSFYFCTKDRATELNRPGPEVVE